MVVYFTMSRSTKIYVESISDLTCQGIFELKSKGSRLGGIGNPLSVDEIKEQLKSIY